MIAHLDEALNGFHQRADAVMAAAFDLALGEQSKPAFHLVEPGGMSRSEVEMVAWSFGQPASNQRGLVAFPKFTALQLESGVAPGFEYNGSSVPSRKWTNRHMTLVLP